MKLGGCDRINLELVQFLEKKWKKVDTIGFVFFCVSWFYFIILMEPRSLFGSSAEHDFDSVKTRVLWHQREWRVHARLQWRKIRKSNLGVEEASSKATDPSAEPWPSAELKQEKNTSSKEEEIKKKQMCFLFLSPSYKCPFLLFLSSFHFVHWYGACA